MDHASGFAGGPGTDSEYCYRKIRHPFIHSLPFPLELCKEIEYSNNCGKGLNYIGTLHN